MLVVDSEGKDCATAKKINILSNTLQTTNGTFRGVEKAEKSGILGPEVPCHFGVGAAREG